jgi:hypothetical protein
LTQQPGYIVFQCYGNEGIFHECAYALLSLACQYKDESDVRGIEVWIYTDKPEWFDLLKGINLSINFRTIDSNIINEWRGKINFVHRMKIEVLKDFTRERNGNMLYADTDVVFTRRIDGLMQRIEAGDLFMHVMEGIVSQKGNPILAKLDRYIRTSVPMKVNGKSLNDLAMWNAGVIGFNTRYRYVLDEVLAFTDKEYPRFPKHIIEQFAFSVFFQKAGDIKAASSYLLHYWNLKEARETLASFFAFFKDKGIEELARCSALVQMPVLMQEKMNFMNNRNVAEKLLDKHWKPARYQWQELMKQL